LPQGRNIHPGTWHSSMYIRMGSTRCTSNLAACAWEIYTQGHGIPPCIYQNGIYTVPPLATTSSLCHKGNIHRDMASMYISEWDLHGAAH
jgi:hypothetical protein